ncbi:MAG: hypothetical protein M3394_05700 [Actinomycetota bacterium]|nr:hypothetical protein [Actinomycetota bacterium]
MAGSLAPQASPATEEFGSLRVVGTMPAGFTFPGYAPLPPGLLVDPRLHRGFLIAGTNTGRHLFAYDLRALELIGQVPVPPEFDNSSQPAAAIDPDGHRIFFLNNLALNVTNSCEAQRVWVLDTRSFSFTARPLPCLSGPLREGFVADGMSFDERSGRLYVVGSTFAAASAYNILGGNGSRRDTVVRQIDPDSWQPEWDADISEACEWHDSPGSTPVTVVRAGNHVVTYCYHGGSLGGASRGVTVALPLVGGRPARAADGKVATKVAPTFNDPNVLTEVDPETARVVVVAGNRPFGPAVWVSDPLRGGFVGVLPTGLDPNQSSVFDYVFDETAGRLYLHSARGFVVVDVRNTPLPGGISFDVAAYPQDERRGTVVMGIDPGLRRLFLPNEEHDGWLVVEDRVPPPPPVAPVDPDAGTADIPEQPGITDRSYSSGASAVGAHVLVAGGVPAIVHQATLREDCFHRNFKPESPCAADVVASPGNREYFLAQTSAGLGSTVGARAFASAGRASPRDSATDADVRSLGRCYADRVEYLYGSPPPLLEQFCPQSTPEALRSGSPLGGLTFENLREGTAPRSDPARDFPVPSSFCADGGDKPTSSDPRGTPAGAGTSDATCNAASLSSSSKAATTAVNLLGLGSGAPGIVVGRTWSEVGSRFVAGTGLVTTARAGVDGFRVLSDPPMTIGSMATEATTYAYGRTGTSKTFVSRSFAGVRSPEYTCDRDCDPERVVSALNNAFGTIVSARSHPAYEFASPRGYTAVVAKDPLQAVSDAAINDNDSVTFNALDIVVVNDYDRGTGADGQQNVGRSRITIGLAGVQAESHYGVFLLPTGTAQEAGGGPGEASGLSGAAPGMGSFSIADAVLPDAVGPYAIAPIAASAGGRHGAGRIARFPRTIEEAVRLIVNHPAQAALLALLLALLAAPLWLNVRRRAAAVFLEGT